MNVHGLLTIVRDALRRSIVRIDSRLHPPEPEPILDPDELARLAREQHRREQRAGRTPWYYRRPQPVEVPESLKYYEVTNGTKATIDMLQRRAHKHEGDSKS